MRLFRRKPIERLEPVTDEEEHGTSLDEARQARLASELSLRHAQARDPSVRATASSLRVLRARNGFAADWRAAMSRRPT